MTPIDTTIAKIDAAMDSAQGILTNDPTAKRYLYAAIDSLRSAKGALSKIPAKSNALISSKTLASRKAIVLSNLSNAYHSLADARMNFSSSFAGALSPRNQILRDKIEEHLKEAFTAMGEIKKAENDRRSAKSIRRTKAGAATWAPSAHAMMDASQELDKLHTALISDNEMFSAGGIEAIKKKLDSLTTAFFNIKKSGGAKSIGIKSVEYDALVEVIQGLNQASKGFNTLKNSGKPSMNGSMMLRNISRLSDILYEANSIIMQMKNIIK